MPDDSSSTGDMDAPSRVENGLSGQAPQIQEIIITLFGEYAETGSELWSGGLTLLLQDLGFSEAASRIALGRVVARGLLERSKVGRKVYYRATERMADLLAEGHRQTFWFRYSREPWDGSWTFVWYAIPEDQLLARRRFGRRLAFVGFAPLQDGVWVAPRHQGDLQGVVERLGIEEFVVVVEGGAAPWIPQERILTSAWDLDELVRRYEQFVAHFASYVDGGGQLTDLEALVVRTHALEAFRQLAPLEPKVAPEGAGWVESRRRAIDCFTEVEQALKSRASAHVDLRCTSR